MIRERSFLDLLDLALYGRARPAGRARADGPGRDRPLAALNFWLLSDRRFLASGLDLALASGGALGDGPVDRRPGRLDVWNCRAGCRGLPRRCSSGLPALIFEPVLSCDHACCADRLISRDAGAICFLERGDLARAVECVPPVRALEGRSAAGLRASFSCAGLASSSWVPRSRIVSG